MIRALAICAALICVPVQAIADAGLTRLYDLLEFDAYIQVLRAEGLEETGSLSQDMLGRPADGAFYNAMDRIYDPQRIAETTRKALSEEMSAHQIARAVTFFSLPSMQRIIELEVAARRAMSDPTVEEVAIEAWRQAEEERPWLSARIAELSQVNDLLDRNVTGALNANLQFFRGLADGNALDMSEEDILAQVWSQESEIRTETESWLGAYLILAYDPVAQADLQDYVAFWSTDTGKALNRAIFAGFNTAYDEISYATGRTLALLMETQDL